MSLERLQEVSKVHYSNLNSGTWKGEKIMVKIAHVREVEVVEGLPSEVELSRKLPL